MINYPNINPIAFHLGPIPVHWYGLMYLFGFSAAWWLANAKAKKSGLWTSDQVADLIFYGALGVVLGGRIGYMLIYDLPGLVANPELLLKIWQGGMSFHGGLIGVCIALAFFCRKYKKTFFDVTDFIVPFVPLGLAAGRIGNFINGELWGKVSTVPWAMIFPNAGPLPRHPSMLYECLLEGVLLFIMLMFYSRKTRPKMAVSGLFLFLYGIFRFVVEFYRLPDIQLGYIAFGWLTMGQILSLPMVFFGILLLILAYREKVQGDSKLSF